MALDVPVPFAGTKEEARRNFASHQFVHDDDGTPVCVRCDSKVWHESAAYLCGDEVPRMLIYGDDDLWVPFVSDPDEPF